jgi:hypothetical protein
MLLFSSIIRAHPVQAPTGLCGAPRFRAPAPPLRDVPPLRCVAASHPFNPLRTNRSGFRRMGSGVPAPVELDLCGTGFGGSPCRLDTNNTLNVSRATLGAPDGLNLRKTGFGGTPCRLDTNNTLNVSRAFLGANPLRTNRKAPKGL